MADGLEGVWTSGHHRPTRQECTEGIQESNTVDITYNQAKEDRRGNLCRYDCRKEDVRDTDLVIP